jgi:hypothetical protein
MNMNKITYIYLIGLICVLMAACAAQESAQDEDILIQGTHPVELADENEQPLTEEAATESMPTETAAPTEIIATQFLPQETVALDCYGADPNVIGMGIAESFPETTYELVMAWFCNGAEFEDILVALQTERITDFPASEMLLMLADDWTWDEIWQVTGLTEE